MNVVPGQEPHSVDRINPPTTPDPSSSSNAASLSDSSSSAPSRRRRRRSTRPVSKLPTPPYHVRPLLTQVLGSNARKSLSPDDWSNIVLQNRGAILRMKLREQQQVWRKFQQMKLQKIQWLEARGEKVSEEMKARIAAREASIMKISAAARAKMAEPIPPLPELRETLPSRREEHAQRVAAMGDEERAPVTHMQTTLINQPWRTFTFRLMHYHPHVLHRQMEKFCEMAKKLGLNPSKPTYLPRRIKKFNIIRGPHVDKHSREQFETRIYTLLIHISPSVDKFYAVKRLHQLTFRLVAGNVRMRIETPANTAIETSTFAPDPTKADESLGLSAPQVYAVRDSPGIDGILYKLDQHQFPFLRDWEEEILDEKFRGIYEEEKAMGRHPFLDDADEAFNEDSDSADFQLADGEGEGEGEDAELDAEDESERDIFDEDGQFASSRFAMEVDEDDPLAIMDSESIEIDDDRSEAEKEDDAQARQVQPLVPRQRRGHIKKERQS